MSLAAITTACADVVSDMTDLKTKYDANPNATSLDEVIADLKKLASNVSDLVTYVSGLNDRITALEDA